MAQIPEKAKMETEKSNSKDQNRIGVRGILFVENLFYNRMISD